MKKKPKEKYWQISWTEKVERKIWIIAPTKKDAIRETMVNYAKVDVDEKNLNVLEVEKEMP